MRSKVQSQFIFIKEVLDLKNIVSLESLKGAIVEYIDNGMTGVQPTICIFIPSKQERYFITITNSHRFSISKE